MKLFGTISLTRSCLGVLVGCILCLSAEAQFAPRIGSAEPGNTPGATAVGKRILQFQQGYSFSSLRLAEPQLGDRSAPTYDSLYGQQRHFQTNVIRYGLFERLELRARLFYNNRTFLAEGDGNFSNAAAANGFAYDFGFRFNLVHLTESGFDLAVQSDYGRIYQDVSSGFNISQYSVLLLASQRFAKHFVLTLNGGFLNNQNDVLVGRASLRYFVGDCFFHLGYTHEEVIASNINDLYTNAYFFAVAYYLSNDLLLNIESSFASGYSGNYVNSSGYIQENIFNIGAGVSWRLNFRD
jgi:hypothetical protein